MPQLQFTFDTGAVPLSRIVDAIALEYGYQAITNGSPNPETKAQFSRRMIGTVIKNIVKNQDLHTARIAAEATVTPINLD